MKWKTEWFPGTVHPVRVGWYERDYSNCECKSSAVVQMCYWTGKEWSAGQGEAYQIPYFASNEQELPWRGLAR